MLKKIRNVSFLSLVAACCVLFLACGGGSNTQAPPSSSAPTITTQPTNKTVMAGQTATFTVMASGTAPLQYQWKKGSELVGTNLASYTTPATTTTDNGAKFSVAVTNAAGHADSQEATLTVQTSEIFDDSNRPGLEYNGSSDYFLVKPWNYEKDYNSTRKYPLLIYLHGSSQTKYLKNLRYMGMGYYTWSDALQNMTEEYDKPMADNFRKTYPCFMYVPQGPSGFNFPAIIAQIEKIKTDFRIDTNRIYVHGFSMGGMGTYQLANAYSDYNGQLFAGIIRLTSGDSVTTVRDEIARKTAIWLQVGLLDTSVRITVIRDSYTFLNNHAANAGAIESTRTYTVGTHAAQTWTLTKSGMDIVKRTEYPNDDHFITEFPFTGDPSVMAWLFDQSLLKR